MVPVELNWERDVEPVVRKYAARAFARHANGNELVDDAVSLAWEAFAAARKRIAPSQFAWYAIRRAKSQLQFQQSERSITGPNPRRVRKPLRDRLVEVEEITAAPGDNPADVATVNVDFAEWILTLSEREVQFLIAFLNGETTGDAAAHFGVSLGRVSQIRRELLEHYTVFTS